MKIKILENNVRSLSSLLQTQSVLVRSLASELKKAKADIAAKDAQLENKVNRNTNRSAMQSAIVHSLVRELKKAKADLAAKDAQLESKVKQNTNRLASAVSKANQALQKAGTPI